jgi:hypothetical protein
MERFKASVQYGDWEGTASADGNHSSDFSEYLRKKKLISDSEYLVAISFYAGERDFTSIRAFVVEKGENYESVRSLLKTASGPVKVREIELELSRQEFFALFKRFSVVLTWHGLDLEDREYDS